MANTKSAEKRIVQSEKKRVRNRSNKSRLRTAVKALRTTIESGDAAAAAGLLPATLKIVDESAGKGAVHRNAADRTKSRLTRAVNGMKAGAASA